MGDSAVEYSGTILFKKENVFFIIGGKGFWKLFKIILVFSVLVPGTVLFTRQQGALLPLKKTWEFKPRV